MPLLDTDDCVIGKNAR